MHKNSNYFYGMSKTDVPVLGKLIVLLHVSLKI